MCNNEGEGPARGEFLADGKGQTHPFVTIRGTAEFVEHDEARVRERVEEVGHAAHLQGEAGDAAAVQSALVRQLGIDAVADAEGGPVGGHAAPQLGQDLCQAHRAHKHTFTRHIRTRYDVDVGPAHHTLKQNVAITLLCGVYYLLTYVPQR